MGRGFGYVSMIHCADSQERAWLCDGISIPNLRVSDREHDRHPCHRCCCGLKAWHGGGWKFEARRRVSDIGLYNCSARMVHPDAAISEYRRSRDGWIHLPAACECTRP